MIKKHFHSITVSTQAFTVNAFIAILFIILPLYAPEGYHMIGERKWDLYRGVVPVFLLLISLAIIVRIAVKRRLCLKNGRLHKWVRTLRIFTVSYIIVCIVSYLGAVDRGLALWGTPDFHMGVFSQISFCLLLLLISLAYKENRLVIAGIVATAAVVSALGLLMRLGMDLTGFYRGVLTEDTGRFLSTIGQDSWYSSYIVILLPFSMAGYCYGQEKRSRLINAAVLSIGTMSLVVQNTDSAFLALFFSLVVLLWIAAEDRKPFGRFLEICLMILIGFRLVGIIELIINGGSNTGDRLRLPSSGSLAVFMRRSPVMLAALVLMAAIVILWKRYNARVLDSWLISFRRMIIIAILALLTLSVIYIALNTAGILPGAVSSYGKIVYFDDSWGNNRGLSWRIGWDIFDKASPYRKLFGQGSDCFPIAAYDLHGADIRSVFYDRILGNAHNEWINVLVNQGLLGLICYLGIFMTAFCYCIKKRSHSQIYMIAAMAIAAYSAHNFFCYQLIVCTPFIFIIIAMAIGTDPDMFIVGEKEEKR